MAREDCGRPKRRDHQNLQTAGKVDATTPSDLDQEWVRLRALASRRARPVGAASVPAMPKGNGRASRPRATRGPPQLRRFVLARARPLANAEVAHHCSGHRRRKTAAQTSPRAGAAAGRPPSSLERGRERGQQPSQARQSGCVHLRKGHAHETAGTLRRVGGAAGALVRWRSRRLAAGERPFCLARAAANDGSPARARDLCFTFL
jgi:hypothetical protein